MEKIIHHIDEWLSIYLVVLLAVAISWGLYAAVSAGNVNLERYRQAEALEIQRGENAVTDFCRYQDAMLSCLERLPKGAERLTASGNDWDEVAEVCKDFASKASYRMAKNVKEECR